MGILGGRKKKKKKEDSKKKKIKVKKDKIKKVEEPVVEKKAPKKKKSKKKGIVIMPEELEEVKIEEEEDDVIMADELGNVDDFDVPAYLDAQRAEFAKIEKTKLKTKLKMGKVYVLALIATCPRSSISLHGHDFPQFITLPIKRGGRPAYQTTFKKERLTGAEIKLIVEAAKRKMIITKQRQRSPTGEWETVEVKSPALNYIVMFPDKRSHHLELLKLEKKLQQKEDERLAMLEQSNVEEGQAMAIQDMIGAEDTSQFITS